MKAYIRGSFLSLALVGMAACGGSSGKDLGADPGADTPSVNDLAADEAGPSDTGLDDTIGRDVPEVSPDSIGPEEVAIEDLPPEPEPDVPPMDEGVTGDLSSEIVPSDVPPEPGDPCEGPECVPCPDDGLECTDSVHGGDDGACVVVVKAGSCLIDGVCFLRYSRDPANPCRTCQPDVNQDAYVAAVGDACTDTTPCSLGGVCTADATCVPAVKPCDDGNMCTVDRCLSGVCDHKPFVSTCDDGDKCTQFDTCVNGVCKGTPVTCVDDHNPCTDEACDPATGRCATTYNTNGCDDLNWCTQDDACQNGVCTGRDRDCSDADPCTRDTCTASGVNVGECKHTATPGQACEDGNLCTSNDMCDMSNICRPGAARVCNDNNACTDDSCDPAIGCVYTPHTRGCDDGDPCTINDVCSPAGCHGTKRSCDDGNPCTVDSCLNGSCLNLSLPNDTGCDDGNECTTGDRCLNSYCVATGTKSCDDGDACTLDACQKGVGCVHSTASCDDNNLCTDDTCNSATGCVHTPNAVSCDDGDPCTLNDVCGAGSCKGAQKDCKDSDPCTNDSCVAGTCVHLPNYGACDDGNACTVGEKCFNGICQGGTTLTCNDLQDCTADSCNPAIGCVYTPIAGDCDDHTACTTGDHCSNGICVGTRLDCSDGNPCTDDLCSVNTGCYHQNNTAVCDDSQPCTILDQCNGGSCAGISVFANPLSKAATLQFTRHGTAGYGLDVDGIPSTCSPAGDCGDGIDNYFGRMDNFIDDQFAPDLNRVVVDGRLSLLLEHESPGPGAGPYGLNVMFGKRTDPTSCDPATAGCNYLAFSDNLVGQCSPRYVLSNATVVGNTLTAGGKEFQAVVYFSFCGGTSQCVMLSQTLKWAQVKATVTLDGSGKVVGGSGVLAGVINVKEFLLLLQSSSLTDAQFSPYTRDQVIIKADNRLCSGPSDCGDVDTDGNGYKDSASIGLPFTIVTGYGVGKI